MAFRSGPITSNSAYSRPSNSITARSLPSPTASSCTNPQSSTLGVSTPRVRFQPTTVRNSSSKKLTSEKLPSTPLTPAQRASLRAAADAELARERALSESRLKSSWELIFEKYGRDFTGIADEVDPFTGDIVVDNGHLRGMMSESEEDGEESDSEAQGTEEDKDDAESGDALITSLSFKEIEESGGWKKKKRKRDDKKAGNKDRLSTPLGKLANGGMKKRKTGLFGDGDKGMEGDQRPTCPVCEERDELDQRPCENCNGQKFILDSTGNTTGSQSTTASLPTPSHLLPTGQSTSISDHPSTTTASPPKSNPVNSFTLPMEPPAQQNPSKSKTPSSPAKSSSSPVLPTASRSTSPDLLSSDPKSKTTYSIPTFMPPPPGHPSVAISCSLCAERDELDPTPCRRCSTSHRTSYRRSIGTPLRSSPLISGTLRRNGGRTSVKIQGEDVDELSLDSPCLGSVGRKWKGRRSLEREDLEGKTIKGSRLKFVPGKDIYKSDGTASETTLSSQKESRREERGVITTEKPTRQGISVEPLTGVEGPVESATQMVTTTSNTPAPDPIWAEKYRTTRSSNTAKATKITPGKSTFKPKSTPKSQRKIYTRATATVRMSKDSDAIIAVSPGKNREKDIWDMDSSSDDDVFMAIRTPAPKNKNSAREKGKSTTKRSIDPWTAPLGTDDPFYNPLWDDHHPDGTPAHFPRPTPTKLASGVWTPPPKKRTLGPGGSSKKAATVGREKRVMDGWVRFLEEREKEEEKEMDKETKDDTKSGVIEKECVEKTDETGLDDAITASHSLGPPGTSSLPPQPLDQDYSIKPNDSIRSADSANLLRSDHVNIATPSIPSPLRRHDPNTHLITSIGNISPQTPVVEINATSARQHKSPMSPVTSAVVESTVACPTPPVTSSFKFAPSSPTIVTGQMSSVSPEPSYMKPAHLPSSISSKPATRTRALSNESKKCGDLDYCCGKMFCFQCVVTEVDGDGENNDDVERGRKGVARVV